MTLDTLKDIEKFEADLWEAADNLRANSKLTSSDYFVPVLGVIFLRHAANRFEASTKQIQEDQATGKMPKRPPVNADYVSRPSFWLPERARYDVIMDKAATSGNDLPKLVTEAMTAIESEFEPLQGVLPKDYGIFEPKVLEDLMRLFNSERIKQASGYVFGRIYEYFSCQVLRPKGARQRRILHTFVAGPAHRQCHRAGSRYGVRSGLRLGRHVPAVQPLHRA
jgi:type I restriction enzyme M protein